MIRNNYYYAKVRGSFINYLNLFSDNPIRLKNTIHEKESILYSDQEIKKLLKIHPEIEIEYEEISAYTRRTNR